MHRIHWRGRRVSGAHDDERHRIRPSSRAYLRAHSICQIAHADRPMQDWVEAWETQFNLGSGEVATDAIIVRGSTMRTTLVTCFRSSALTRTTSPMR
jgi:hypothetical protein